MLDAGSGSAAEELSKVMHTLKAASGGEGVTPFVRLLRAGHDAGDYASFMAHARGLSAAALDREVRALQVRAHALLPQTLLTGAAAAGRHT